MILENQIETLIGTTAYDSNGNKIGKVGQVVLDNRTGRPEWLTINTGLFGMKETFVPTQRAEVRDDSVVVPYEKDEVKNAPNVDVDRGHLSPEEELQLYRYYHLEYGEPVGRAAEPGTDVGVAKVPGTSAGTDYPSTPAHAAETDYPGTPAHAAETDHPSTPAHAADTDHPSTPGHAAEPGTGAVYDSPAARLRPYQSEGQGGRHAKVDDPPLMIGEFDPEDR